MLLLRWLCFSLVLVGGARGIIISEVLDVLKLSKDAVIAITKAWNVVDQHVDFGEVPIPIFDKTEKKLFDRIGVINQKVEHVSDLVEAVGYHTMTTIIHSLPERVRLELRLNDFLDYQNRINVHYKDMLSYVKDQDDFERSTLSDFAKTVISHDSSSTRSLLQRIHNFIAPKERGITDTGIISLLSKQLEAMPYDITHGLETIESVYAYSLAYSDLRGIYALYETFRRFQVQQTGEGRQPAPKRAWNDLADAILTDPNSNIKDALTRLHGIVRGDLFRTVKKEVEGDMLCNSKQSPQQVLYNLYNAVALTEIKGYTMIQFSYMLLRLYNEGNYTKETQIMRERYENRTNTAIKIARTAMQSSSRELWNCDPKKHVKGETYEEITQLIQGYVQNEVDLNPDGTCRENCAEYTYTKSHGCYQNLYCRQQRQCNGKVIDCKFVDSDMWICQADPQTGRRYEYVEYENGRVLGRKKGCRRGTTKVDSWWRYLFWHCSYCMCLCDEEGPMSDRYFNMRPSIANISNNRIVTGLRFVKKNRIIHLQIQEAKLLPRGKVDVSTLHWVPPQDYKITDKGVHNGKDYHTLTWEKRAMDLDDLEVNEGYILTGVRFKEIGSHLNFEIYMTPFDFETGTLLEPNNKSQWKDNPNTDSSLKNPRTRVRLNHPDVSINTPNPSVPDSKSDQYIEFVNTDMDRDAAQTTVPFLDAQKVESLQPVPLSGAGIFHKGRNNFGGFIAPKIITYDISKHLKFAFPEEENQEPLPN